MDIKTIALKLIPSGNKYRFTLIRILKKGLFFLRYLPGTSIHFGPPRGIYMDADSYNSRNKLYPIREIKLCSEQKKERKLPITNSPLVLSKFSKYLSGLIIEKKAFILYKARYLYGYGGTVITSDDKIFLPCSPLRNELDPNKHQSLYLFRLKKRKNFQKVILIDTRSASENYCHWLRDHLPRFYWLRNLNLDLSDYTLISSDGGKPYNYFSWDILKANGFIFKERLNCENVNHFYADELIIPPYVTRALNGDYNSFDENEREFLQNLFLRSDATDHYERIYLSRRKSLRTSPSESEMVERLSLYNVKEIFLEDHNISEQAALFNNAKMIIGVHGAAFANLFFCKAGTIIVEIFSTDYIVTDYWATANELNVHYFAYCEDKVKHEEIPHRLGRHSPTNVIVDNFISFFDSIVNNKFQNVD